MMVSLNLNFCSDALLHMEKTLTPHLFLLNSVKKQGRERTDRCTRPLMAISRSTLQPHLPVFCTLPPIANAVQLWIPYKHRVLTRGSAVSCASLTPVALHLPVHLSMLCSQHTPVRRPPLFPTPVKVLFHLM